MRICSIFLALMLTTYAAAQVPPPPAELAKFDVALGNWEGSGSAYAAADGPAMPWTSVSTYSKILDGYAIQEDTRVDIPNFGALIIRSIYAWDSHASRFISFSVSNMGFGGHGNVYWTADGKLVSSNTKLEQGQVVTDGSVSEWTKGSYKFHIDRSLAGGKFFRHVEGKYQRGDEGFDAAKATERLAIAPAPEELEKLGGHLGKWRVTGKFSPLPDVPLQPIAGQNDVRSILGGHAHFTDIIGDDAPPKAYRGNVYLVWDKGANSYKGFSVDNYGGLAVENAYRQGENKMVYTASHVLWGMPQAGRTVVEWDNETGETKMTSHRAAGAHAPDVSFEATLKRVTGD